MYIPHISCHFVLSTKTVSHLHLWFYLSHLLPITYLLVSECWGTYPTSLVTKSVPALGSLHIRETLSFNSIVVGHIALPFKSSLFIKLGYIRLRT